jgi:hypothetical protein
VFSGDFERAVITPNQLRWRPFSVPDEPVDFVRGLFTICGAGRCAAHLCHRELLPSRGEAHNPAACDFPECGVSPGWGQCAPVLVCSFYLEHRYTFS